MLPEYANDPKHVAQIHREWQDYQHRKGLWPRGHWHRQAAALDVKVSALCPPLSDMPAFLSGGSAAPEPPPEPEPESRVARRAKAKAAHEPAAD